MGLLSSIAPRSEVTVAPMLVLVQIIRMPAMRVTVTGHPRRPEVAAKV